jgi:hypothetical protein
MVIWLHCYRLVVAENTVDRREGQREGKREREQEREREKVPGARYASNGLPPVTYFLHQGRIFLSFHYLPCHQLATKPVIHDHGL